MRTGAWLCLFLFMTCSESVFAQRPAPPAADVWAIYDPDPNHAWNRVIRALFEMRGPEGEDLPHAWPESLLKGKRYRTVLQALDEFARTNADRRIRDPVARVLFQHDLLEIFNWSVPIAISEDGDIIAKGGAKARSRALQRRLVSIMRAVALEPGQIYKLSDPYGNVIRSRAFAADYDPAARGQPFLPPDLFEKNGSWTLLVADAARAPVATLHAMRLGMNSHFAVLLSIPGPKEETRVYIDQHNAFGARQATAALRTDVPPGTRVALVRRMLAIDKDGKVHVTPIVERMQFRVYRNRELPSQYPSFPNFDQDVFLFRLDRGALARREAVTLKPVGPDDHTTHGLELIYQDPRPFPTEIVLPGAVHGSISHHSGAAAPILTSCHECHGMPGVLSLQHGTAIRAGEDDGHEAYVHPRGSFFHGYLMALWRMP